MKEVKFVHPNGQLAYALGVSVERNALIEKTVKEQIEKNASMQQLIEHVRDNLDLNPSEWSSFMFALGAWQGRLHEREQQETAAIVQSDFQNAEKRFRRMIR